MITSTADLLDPSVVRDPHATFAEVRAHGRPVWLERHRAWMVAGHSAVNEGFRDLRLSSDRLTPMERRLSDANRDTLGTTIELLRGWMVFHDPPDHTRLREPLRRAFTPARLAGLRPRIEAVVDELCDAMEDRSEVDLLSEFTFPLPAIVIAELLGVPAEDREDFKHWSDQLSAIVFGSPDRAGRAAVAAAGSERFSGYFTELIDRYRNHPEDNLVSALIAVTEDDPDGAGLATDELVGACTMLLFGGHETTTTLVSNAMRSLMTHPDQRRRLIESPDMVPQAVEELHRFDGSTKIMVRVVGEGHERGGETFEPGQTVFLGVMGANRDPDVFERPDLLDLTRPNSRHHLGFGYGIHFCLGAALARLEAEIAVGALVRRFPEMTHDPDAVVYPETLLSRSVASLPVALRP
jgi:cytochrome P450